MFPVFYFGAIKVVSLFFDWCVVCISTLTLSRYPTFWTSHQAKGIPVNTQSVINVSTVPHRSLFRYPGGKTWLVPHVRRWLASIPRPTEFGESFAGGGIVGLSVVFEDLANTATLVELDESIAAVWRVVLNGDASALAQRIVNFEVTLESVRKILDASPRSLIDKAFATIVRNRMQRGGIMAPGASLMKAGENGKGLMSRWYPETLKKRILDITAHKQRINFVSGDGLEYLRGIAKRKDVACLIDPPYTVAGRRLYAHSAIDHDELFRIASTLNGDFLMTYDNSGPVIELARKHGFDTETVAMKNTHHAVMSELLIGNNLDWCRTIATPACP